ncbi:MAG: tetratricopeptide repeat protein [Gemmatimonadota bacterium]
MAKHRNVPHHSHEDPDDKFVAAVVTGTDWFKRNSRVVTIAAIALFIVVAGGLYWVRYQRTLREAGSAQLSGIRQTVATGNTPLAMRDLTTFLDNFGATPSGGEGRLLMAQLLLVEGRNEEALQAASQLAADLRDPLGPGAARLAAAAYEQMDRLPEAEQEFLRIAESAPRSFERHQAMADAARIRAQRGDAQGAADLYRQLLDSVPETDPQYPIIRLRLGEVEARSGA